MIHNNHSLSRFMTSVLMGVAVLLTERCHGATNPSRKPAAVRNWHENGQLWRREKSEQGPVETSRKCGSSQSEANRTLTERCHGAKERDTIPSTMPEGRAVSIDYSSHWLLKAAVTYNEVVERCGLYMTKCGHYEGDYESYLDLERDGSRLLHPVTALRVPPSSHDGDARKMESFRSWAAYIEFNNLCFWNAVKAISGVSKADDIDTWMNQVHANRVNASDDSSLEMKTWDDVKNLMAQDISTSTSTYKEFKDGNAVAFLLDVMRHALNMNKITFETAFFMNELRYQNKGVLHDDSALDGQWGIRYQCKSRLSLLSHIAQELNLERYANLNISDYAAELNKLATVPE